MTNTKAKAAGVVALAVAGTVLVAVLAYALGTAMLAPSREAGVSTSAGYEKYVSVGQAPQEAAVAETDESRMYGLAAEDMATAEPAGAPSESLIVRNSQIEVRVDDVNAALSSLRGAVTAAGGEIAQMTVTRGDDVVIDGASANAPAGPAYANVTIRVPAAQLTQLERRVAELGVVLSQSVSADDVTEAAIDLEARLKNLRAEEARLRSFLGKTTDVSELLEVERELARVRGDIESMDAQLTYLERQAARATLTVALSEPGPVAESSGIWWALREALARGIAVAAAMITGLVTIVVPMALVGIIVLLVAVPVRAIRHRRAERPHPSTTSPTDGDTEQ
jgi:hypothetical protein